MEIFRTSYIGCKLIAILMDVLYHGHCFRVRLDKEKKERLIGITKLVTIERKRAEDNDEGAIVRCFPLYMYYAIII
jgi:hypothetical protein